MSAIENRYDFVLLFDVRDGNPNGDPDAGNLPRVDAETGRGLVTDVAIKRKIRNFVSIVKDGVPPYDIYVKEKSILNTTHARAYEESEEVREAVRAWEQWQEDKKDKKKKSSEKAPAPKVHYEDIAKRWVCDNFFDVRTFGAVMSTSDKISDEIGASQLKKTAGQVRGPVQITFARSIDPIIAQEHAISVCTARKADKSVEEQIGIQGRKFTVPYGLYRTHGFISAHLANQTGFSDEDLELLWQSLINMFDHDRSAARGEMSCRGLYVFKHDSKLGNAPAHSLFDRIKVESNAQPPRAFGDYQVEIEEGDLPSGVELMRLVG